jgi:hypothetical protein
MKTTLALLVAPTALTAAICVPAWSAMSGSAEPEDRSLAAAFDPGRQASPLLFVSDDDDDGNRGHRRSSGRDDDDDDDDRSDDDDDDDDNDAEGLFSQLPEMTPASGSFILLPPRRRKAVMRK